MKKEKVQNIIRRCAVCVIAVALSIIYFPMPDQDLREELWRRMLPSSWLPADADKMIRMAATSALSGGSISNVIRRCALRLLKQDTPRLDSDILSMAIRRELNKEGRW